MGEYVTSADRKPPPHPFYGDSYERGKDPWHADAFKGGLEHIGEMMTQGPRAEGWFLIDGCGNAIGFVPDGTEYEERPDLYIVSRRSVNGGARQIVRHFRNECDHFARTYSTRELCEASMAPPPTCPKCEPCGCEVEPDGKDIKLDPHCRTCPSCGRANRRVT